MTSGAEKIVNDFLNAWPRRNLGELTSFFTDDCVYHNIPMVPARGKAEIRAMFESFLAVADSIELKVLKSAATGDVVFNERIDIFTRGPRRLELPVAGVFELSGGKISGWREYFDLASWESFAK